MTIQNHPSIEFERLWKGSLLTCRYKGWTRVYRVKNHVQTHVRDELCLVGLLTRSGWPSMLDHSWRDFRLFSNVVNCLAQENVNDKTSGKNERAIFFQILKIPKQCQIVHSFVFALTNYFLISYLPFTSGWTVPNGLYQNYKIHKTLKYNK